MLNTRRLQLLKDILQQPSAPFREQHVIRCVTRHLNKSGVPYFSDPVGNLVIGVKSELEYRRLLRKKSKEPVRVFLAHMDHPGFHGVKWASNNRLQIKWHGGSPIKHLSGAKVWLANDDMLLADGHLTKIKLLQSRMAIDTAEVLLSNSDSELNRLKAKSLYGSFSFRSHYWISRKRLYTRAADDLVGVFTILSTAIDLFQRGKSNQSFLGILTRAEEVGFVGAVRHLQTGWLDARKRPVVCVSLEASRTLPHAVVGKGPVVRLGDRRTIFDSGYLQVLTQIAEKILPGRYQRRIMDGGSCEATATTAWGLPTIGITLPLGNYHNQGYEGGMDCPHPEGPAPEFVHLDDIDGELKLCRGLMQKGLNWHDSWSPVRLRLDKIANKYNKLL
jgi:putative aminopeptidase FrvX